jgi:L-serine dehydratase
VEKGIKDSPGTSKFSGGNGSLLSLYASRKARKDDKSYLKAAGYAIAVAERNAAHKKIIASPTAGASGILPGVLYMLWEEYSFTDMEMYDGLLVSAFIGLVINNIVPTAGATHGCQAETGIGSAMAAAMAAHLLGGDTYTAVNAAVLALKNNLGMVCDPIAGRVEIPCIKRNGFKAVEAIVAARMSLAGVRSNVSASEIVKAMDEIGKNMKAIYRETSGGGLAGTIRGRDEPRCGVSYRLCCGCS